MSRHNFLDNELNFGLCKQAVNVIICSKYDTVRFSLYDANWTVIIVHCPCHRQATLESLQCLPSGSERTINTMWNCIYRDLVPTLVKFYDISYIDLVLDLLFAYQSYGSKVKVLVCAVQSLWFKYPLSQRSVLRSLNTVHAQSDCPCELASEVNKKINQKVRYVGYIT